MSKAQSLKNIIDYSEKIFDSDGADVGEEYDTTINGGRETGEKFSVSFDDSDTHELNDNVMRGLFVQELKNGFNNGKNEVKVKAKTDLPFVERDFDSDSDVFSDPDYSPKFGEEEEEIDDAEDDFQDEKDFEYLEDPDESLVYEGYHPDDRKDLQPMSEIETEVEDIEDPNSIEPPATVKSHFILYLLKCSPLVLVVLFLVLISNVFSEIPSQGNDSGFVHHKLYLLDKELKSINDWQSKLEATISSMVKENAAQEPVVLANGTDVTGYIESLRSNLTAVSDRIDSLQSWVNVHQEPVKEEMEAILSQFKQQLKDQLDAIKNVSRKEEVKKVEEVSRDEPSTIPPTYHTYQSRYTGRSIANVAGTARVLSRLTTLPKMKRVRTKVMDRVLHGFSDFARRTLLKKSQRSPVIGLEGINLVSEENTPNNALLEDPRRYWQALTEDIPISFTVGLQEPIYLQEVGISHPRYRYLMKSAPKLVELFVKPAGADMNGLDCLRERLTPFYNQDFLSTALKSSFVKIGEMTYDVSRMDQYQQFNLSKELKLILAEFQVEWVTLVIDSNWGNQNVTVLDTIRIFGMNQLEMKRYLSNDETVRNLGDDESF
ncbi:DEKNAAC101686 [Brettanomyces naardenensis]|uniref:DEKNAAC101686 n=1 Tax=Brettanomyces naardenensis TaxID=13370 RepID=A0A448YIW4_BRENA|nr:DEKNAAC101686 [Brettanomyces naardenensis]